MFHSMKYVNMSNIPLNGHGYTWVIIPIIPSQHHCCCWKSHLDASISINTPYMVRWFKDIYIYISYEVSHLDPATIFHWRELQHFNIYTVYIYNHIVNENVICPISIQESNNYVQIHSSFQIIFCSISWNIIVIYYPWMLYPNMI